MKQVERFETGWRVRAGGLELDVDCGTGCLSRLVASGQGAPAR